MRKLLVLSIIAVTMGVTSAAQASSSVRYEIANRNIWRAIEFAGPVFKVSPNRLHYRASHEGGHGDWIWNSQGSSAGGWFQFMEGTYYSYSTTAFREAWKRGYHIPMKFNSWKQPLGQALTAAYMFYRGLECTRVGWEASC